MAVDLLDVESSKVCGYNIGYPVREHIRTFASDFDIRWQFTTDVTCSVVIPMQSRITLLISLAIFICCGTSATWAQKPDKKEGKGPAAWDRNKDGLLQTDEIPPKLRPQVKAWATKLKLDPNRPLPIDKLVRSKDKRKKLTDEEKAAKKAERKKAKSENKDKVAEEKKPTRRVAGFGKDSQTKTAGSKPKAVQDADKKEAEKTDKESSRERRRKRQYTMLAKSLLYQNDTNKNGRLERNEWKKLKGNPAASDLDKDGVLTTDELAAHLQGFGSRERDVTRRAPSRSNRATQDKNGKSYRFLTPHERLPEGLPGWFTERDYNVDGQISLFEYEEELTKAKVAKFNQFDLNRDGFIVATEYLKATQ